MSESDNFYFKKIIYLFLNYMPACVVIPEGTLLIKVQGS